MRILLDECLDERLRRAFGGHDCQTARYAKLAGLKNGDLLLAAEAAGFDVIIAVDQNIASQQNFRGRNIALLILSAPTNRLAELRRLVPASLSALEIISRGQVVRVSQACLDKFSANPSNPVNASSNTRCN